MYFNNNGNKILRYYQQGGVLTSVQGEYVNIIKYSGSNSIKLDRWNWVDLVHNQTKIRIIMAYRYIKSCQTMNIVFIQNEQLYCNINRITCSLSAFREDICQLISYSLEYWFEIILAINANENMKDRKL